MWLNRLRRHLKVIPAEEKRGYKTLVDSLNLYRTIMTERDFAYWLNGFVELNGGALPTPAQWKSIQEHLAAVFKKVTPAVGEPKESDIQKSMREFMEKSKQTPPQPVWPIVQPQPYWFQPNMGFPSGTVICQSGQMSTATSGLISC